MKNTKEILSAYTDAKNAMCKIATLLDEAERDVAKKLTPLLGKVGVLRKNVVMTFAEVDVNFGTLGQRVDLYFFSPAKVKDVMDRISSLRKENKNLLTDEDKNDYEILKGLCNGKVKCSCAFTTLDEVEDVIFRVRLVLSIAEVERLARAKTFDLRTDQDELIWSVDGDDFCTCSMD